MSFWFIAALASAAAAALILSLAQRARRTPTPSDPTLAAYQRHLAEVDALAARGLLPETEREAARAEAGRRLLAAVKAPAAHDREAPDWTAPLLAAAAPVLAFGLYLAVGAPGFPDRSYEQRLREWRAAPARLGPAEAAAVLETVVRERPGDAEAHAQLSRARLASGDPFGAIQSAEASARLQPSDPGRWAQLARALLEMEPAQTGEARQALTRALTLCPRDPDARYWMARTYFADNRPDQGRAIWRELSLDLQADDPRRAALLSELAASENPVGPEVDAAIAAMVDGLAARLEAEPLDSEGWARLVRAYAVLGREAEGEAAMAKARRLFAGRPEVLQALEAARAEGRTRSGLRAGG